MEADKQNRDTVNIKNSGDNVTILINKEPALAYSKARMGEIEPSIQHNIWASIKGGSEINK